MSTLPTIAIAHAYITEHGLQNILHRAVNACVHAKAADPISFIIEHLKAVQEAVESNTMVAEEKEEEEESTTTAVVPAVTSKFDTALFDPRWRCAWRRIMANSRRSKALSQGADVNAVTKELLSGATPLHYAAEKGDTEIVDTLIAHGADVKAVDTDGKTPLLMAAKEATR